MADTRPTPGLSLRALADRWQGVALTLAIGTATLWLAGTGRLILYIHPRYVVFTVALVVLGMILALGALAVGDRDAGHEHGPDDGEHDDSGADLGGGGDRTASGRGVRGGRRLLGLIGAVVTVGVAVALVVLPPATLSSVTAGTRDVGASTLSLGASGGSAATASGGATAKYTVLDWATRLRQSTSLGDYAGKAVDVTGFIAASTTDPRDTFVVTRFVITCCAVDAQPVGLTVYDPNWQQSLKKDEWVTVKGGFGANPAVGQSPIAVVPTAVTKVAQPHDPYLY
ncbi:TIGR03943 family putative permease subunit [Frondihabitans australicus]|uniref:Putative repeat protein (TIGR03943 family) n=1 Tax=Frondihabitans australicus TaxID=386892 RepID=A0A495IFR9_9MICO|nr:TIGR03943 family protein [Frondihabitans australicus]RKR74258.1 putative repeat protein (TIGR03943 family) [Frondihabitans australicus]